MTADFPAAIVGYGSADFQNVNSLGSSTLSASISASSTTLTVGSASSVTTWPTANFAVKVDNEIIFASTRSGTTLSGLTRAFDGTTAAAHTSGVAVIVVQSASHINRVAEEIVAIETELGVNGANYVKTISNAGSTGETLVKAKSGSDVPVKRIIAGANITLTPSTDGLQIDASSAAGGAPSSAQYVVMALDGTLSDERTLAAGNGLTLTDGGAAGAATLDIVVASGSNLVANTNDLDWLGTTVRKNSGSNVGTRPRFNFIEGSNVTLTIADDAGGDEIDITINANASTGAPVDAQYLTLVDNGTLSQERVLTAGNGLTLTDAGAGSTATLDIVVASGSNLVANADNIDWTGLTVQNAGTTVATRPKLNFTGSGVTITTTEDSINDRVDVLLTVTGSVTGSGTAGHVTYWSSSSAITSNSDFQWDNTLKQLKLASTIAGSGLVFGADAILRRGDSNRLDLPSGDHLQINAGDLRFDDNSKGVILKDSSNNYWRVTVNSAGNLVTTSLGASLPAT